MEKIIKKLRESNHSIKTRRDFLSYGLVSYAAMTSPLSLFGRALKHAAEECSGGTTSTMAPFLVFDMAGGAALPANFLVGKEGGPEDLLKSYDLLGWDPRESGALNSDFGLPMSANTSGFLEGLLEVTSEEARANFRMGSLCHFAQDDSSSNQLNAGTLALKAGFRGSYITNGLGIMDSLSGGKSRSVIESAAYKPSFVNSLDAIFQSTSFGGPALGQVGLPKLEVLAESAMELSKMQKLDYMGVPGGEELADLSKCSYEKSLEFVSGVQGLDPRENTAAQGVYQIDQNTAASNAQAVAAGISMGTIMGYSGPSVWTLGGCDYHDGGFATGDAKDKEMGLQIGRAVELAHQLEKPLFFQLITDGGCGATKGSRNWTSDSGDKCMTVIGYYDPAGAPTIMKTQIGHYTDGQGADRSTLIGSDPSKVAYAVLANYLNLCGKLGDFPSLAPNIFTGAGELESVLVFEGKSA